MIILVYAYGELLTKNYNMEAEDLLDKFAQDEGFGNWDTVVLNCHHSVIRSVAIAAVNQALHQPPVIGSLPTVDELKPFLKWVFHKADRIWVEHTLGWRDNAIEEMYEAYLRRKQ